MPICNRPVQRISCYSLLILSLVLVAGTSPGQAVLPEGIVEDFKPIDGYVVMVKGEEYIVDVVAASGAQMGDLFTVIGKGEKVVHPVTKKVLGTLQEIKGVLKITRMQEGFSFARALNTSQEITKANPIRRYADMQAVFWDYTGQGQALFKELQEQLPHLKWLPYEQAQQARPPQPQLLDEAPASLFFILSTDGLAVRDPEFSILHTYGQPQAAVPAAPGAPAVAKAPAPAPTPSAESEVAVQYQPDFLEVPEAGYLPEAVVMADFMRHEDHLWMASTDGRTIQLFQVADKLVPVAQTTVPVRRRQILAIKWWQPDAGGPVYLAAATWSDQRATGQVFQFSGEQLVPVGDDLPGILGVLDVDQDNRPETLLVQQFQSEEFFGERFWQLKLVGNEFERSDPPVELPRRFTVLGSVMADLTGDGQSETAFVRDGILRIHQGNKRLFTSTKQMGGTLSHLTYITNPGARVERPNAAFFEISPVAADLDGDGRKELLVPAFEGNFIRTLGIAPGVRRSWLAVVKFEDERFMVGTLGEELQAMIQGLVFHRQQAMLIASAPGTILGEKGSTQLLTYNLAQ